jgi:hypothetical protein
LKSETEKDIIDLEKEKLDYINQIRKIKKDEIVKPKNKVEKLTLWKRIKKVLMGN